MFHHNYRSNYANSLQTKLNKTLISKPFHSNIPLNNTSGSGALKVHLFSNSCAALRKQTVVSDHSQERRKTPEKGKESFQVVSQFR